MPYPYRVPRCYVCHRIAVAQDPETGDSLCASCYRIHLDLRAAAQSLPSPEPEAPSLPGNDITPPPFREEVGR